MRSLIASLVPALLRHLEAYAEVAGEDAREAVTVLARKLAAILVAAAATFVALAHALRLAGRARVGRSLAQLGGGRARARLCACSLPLSRYRS